MAINQINTAIEEQNFNFLSNQSSILHTIETNDITVNGVNVIVNKPKKGDVMCITRYKENDVLLDADKQEVIWIDGLSINLKQLSPLFEPVGICVSIRDNKALVRYKTEKENIKWAAASRWKLPDDYYFGPRAIDDYTFKITLDGIVNDNPFIISSEDASYRKSLIDRLNEWFIANDTNYSAELVELDTDLPAKNTSNDSIDDNFFNRMIISCLVDTTGVEIENIGIADTECTAKHINAIDWYYKNNMFDSWEEGGCCRTKYYDYFSKSGSTPSKPMTSINRTYPVKLIDFTSNENCQILRDNFVSYDEYIESMLIKCPCGAGGAITEEPCGKENTYKLANCTFLNNITGKQEILYTAANYAASIDLNAPKLGKGNWWLPSFAEMVEIMRDVTYETSFWDTKPDIVNRVLTKLNSIDSSWSMLSSSTNRWTSTRYDHEWANVYFGIYSDENLTMDDGSMNGDYFLSNHTATPITIYEF